jgi:Xaa-Pro aminopeptidase
VVVSNRSAGLAAAAWLVAHRLRTVGIEGERLTVSAHAALHRALGSKVSLRTIGALVEKLRVVKDADEIGAIRAAVELGTALLDTAIHAIRPGVRETDVAAELEYAARRAGAEGMSFDTIVAAGPRAALPHGHASTARIPPRGFVVLDFGVILHGYCSDMTRTVYVGKCSPADRKMYRAVREAQRAASEAVRAGVSCSQVDQAARSTLRRAGLARFFTHSTGHGVGLEIHEPPRLGRAQQDKLQAGMVVTIEPGVYVLGRGGVRIEDMVVVTERGCDILTTAPRDLIEL